MELTDDNAKTYAQTTTKIAHKVKNPAQYELSWGEQKFPGEHYVIINNGEVYGCAVQEFEETHEAADSPFAYRKSARVLAVLLGRPTPLTTKTKDGNVEMRGEAPAGHWLVQNPGGEQYAIAPADFARLYKQV